MIAMRYKAISALPGSIPVWAKANAKPVSAPVIKVFRMGGWVYHFPSKVASFPLGFTRSASFKGGMAFE
jgi:hypothetical protein